MLDVRLTAARGIARGKRGGDRGKDGHLPWFPTKKWPKIPHKDVPNIK